MPTGVDSITGTSSIGYRGMEIGEWENKNDMLLHVTGRAVKKEREPAGAKKTKMGYSSSRILISP